MANPRLHDQGGGLKWAITAYLLLVSVAFGIAGMMSREHYGLSHQQTVVYYLGDEASGGMQMPKVYSQLLQTAHVHSFTMPMVFLSLWLGLYFSPLGDGKKKILILGGTLSILTYNAAPFLLRYYSVKAVDLFTVGGVGLFFFYFASAAVILYETWIGLKTSAAR